MEFLANILKREQQLVSAQNSKLMSQVRDTSAQIRSHRSSGQSSRTDYTSKDVAANEFSGKKVNLLNFKVLSQILIEEQL